MMPESPAVCLRLMLAFVGFAACTLVAGCEGPSGDEASLWSEEEYLPPGGEGLDLWDGPSSTASLTDELAPSHGLDGWVSRLRDGVREWTFGDADHPDTDRLIGAVTDLTVVGREVVILDGPGSRLLFLDVNRGTLNGTHGRLGSGPGEFRNATSVAGIEASSGKKLLVVDDFFRIQAFDRAGDSVAHASLIRGERALHGICLASDRLVLHVWPQPGQNALIYPMDPDRALDRSLDLGAPEETVPPVYHHPHPYLGGRLDQTLVACGGSTLAVGNQVVPLVRVFGMDGANQWEVEFRGLALPRIELLGTTVRTSSHEAAGGLRHSLANVRYLSDAVLVVQFTRMDRNDQSASGHPRMDWETFLLDTHTLTAAYVGRVDGTVLAYDPSGDRVIWGRSEPFPQVTATTTRSSNSSVEGR